MLGLIELLVVLVFAIGWAVIELKALRLDRKKQQRATPNPAQLTRSPPNDSQ